MGSHAPDGSAGDADYGRIGQGYRTYRLPEPAFEKAILAALGPARSVVNVGAGAGSYEPVDRQVTPVEPSASMRAQRPSRLAAAIDATAESLPFGDNAFDAAMSTFSVHQWSDLEAGLAEMRRVATGPVVIMTCDPDLVERFWLNDYAPEVLATEARRYPGVDRIAAALGGTVETASLPIPFGCVDGFGEAYYGRPETFLDPGARKANSAWSFVSEETAACAVEHLRTDLEDGTWDRRHGRLRTASRFEGSLILITARP
ncbi:class I SAM-dependent methyltransferase [Glycomyces sp. NRRL B-16210]|uniref:class I SAM-dependent methyltransferase n=1 Tax=Glycomyces sp. NRRL B-16210 TaxID=1463821 RepID=UPI0004BE756A|nr:class I SAM-dependent methyltransferase [Glycomyces sp. NRRL B-16210]